MARRLKLQLLQSKTAVVLGAGHPTALGAARALSLLGARVWGLTRNSQRAGCRSNVWERLVSVPPGGATEWVQCLVDLAQVLDEPAFLLPTQDELVLEISKRRNELSEAYRFLLPEHEIVTTFLDKTRFHSWARTRGFPVPESQVVRTDQELGSVLLDMPHPVIIKPLFRTPEWQRHSPVHKVLRLDSPADLRSIPFSMFDAASAFLVSQWIPGPDSAVQFCLTCYSRDSRMLASHTGRKLLQYPRETGSTAVCVGSENAELQTMTRDVFEAGRFAGLGSLEVKYGPDGRAYIMEPTVGRPNLQSHSAVVCGCNLHAIAMLDALEMQYVGLEPRRRNVVWFEERAILELMAARTLDVRAISVILRQVGRVRRVAGAHFSARDRGPLSAIVGSAVRRAIGVLLSRVARMFRFSRNRADG